MNQPEEPDGPDLSAQDQRDIDVARALSHGLRQADGMLREGLRGEVVVAAAMQSEDERVPVEVLGRTVSTARELDLQELREHPEDLLEELEAFPTTRAWVAAGMEACSSDEDAVALADFISLVHRLTVFRRQ